jgi:drug/metabolite transporter (DMT)-like permease
MFVLVGPNFSAGGTRLLGDALGALTAVFYASYQLAIKRARDAGASTGALMAWSTTITAILLLRSPCSRRSRMLPAGRAAAGWCSSALRSSRRSSARAHRLSVAHLTASLSS